MEQILSSKQVLLEFARRTAAKAAESIAETK
jgi:hypothetical protein